MKNLLHKNVNPRVDTKEKKLIKFLLQYKFYNYNSILIKSFFPSYRYKSRRKRGPRPIFSVRGSPFTEVCP